MNQADWIIANQRYLVEALAKVRAALERHAQHGDAGDDAAQVSAAEADVQPQRAALRSKTPGAPALDTLCATFGLSSFERSVLLLCAGVELDAAVAELCAKAQGNPARAYPTFSLALAALPDPHWSAFTPAAPLRYWRLIELAPPQAGVPLTTSPLRIDERVLHFLTGIQHLDERIDGLIELIPTDDIAPSHQEIANRVAQIWAPAAPREEGTALPVIQLCGADESAKRSIAAAACASIGLRLFGLAAEHLPAGAVEFEGLQRLWEREAALAPGALCVCADTLDRSDPRAVSQTSRLLERVRGPVILTARDRWRPIRRATRTLEVNKPTRAEQRALWEGLLANADEPANGCITRLVSQFNLNRASIEASVQEALSAETTGSELAARLWDAGRAQARPRLEDLAQRIEPVAGWNDLVLPAAEKAMLREIASHIAHQETVYQGWGFAALGSRGLGISALFAGASGTGKTMAAEVLANELRLDLYRIDLSSVVSKYIGETEKNLRRVFDAAEDGGGILFFDEADALFGKRSEVKDSHDRYANIEINYLLQRMESYRGLSVLATNMKASLDPAFMRRLRFIINFPFPDATLRADIWTRIFPAQTPVQDLDLKELAKLDVAGGSIRNIALNAAFLAASAGVAVRMTHIWCAARSEYAKLERPLAEVEGARWR